MKPLRIDFSELRPTRKPTRAEKVLYRTWVTYLSDSKLSVDEVHKRAADFTERGKKPPKPE